MKLKHLNIDSVNWYLERIDSLQVDLQPLWGSMNPGQMFVHVNKLNRIALEKERVPDRSTPVIRDILFWLLTGPFTSWPKGLKVPKDYIPSSDQDFQKAKQTLKSDLKELVEKAHQKPEYIVVSELMGPASLKRWQKLQGVHLHHHLKQFGC